MPEATAPNTDTHAEQLELAADHAIAACGGDAREAVKALIVANEFLEREIEEKVSRGYLRGVRHGRFNTYSGWSLPADLAVREGRKDEHVAKIWFAKSGSDPTRGSAPYALSLSDCVERLSLKQSDYLSGLDVTPRFDRSSHQDEWYAEAVSEIVAKFGLEFPISKSSISDPAIF
jgi:hypothetical protein